MRQVIVTHFGGPEVLEVIDRPDPAPGEMLAAGEVPGAGKVRVRLTSIGMNHADLMARRGEYKLASGDPPFTPGLEGGGVIEAVGPGVDPPRIGQRVVLGADAPRGRRSAGGGTYRSHYVCDASQAIPAPDAVPDDQLGALWLAYLTAWGCLMWKQALRPGQFVAIPAASSSVGLAAAQVVREAGAVPIGLTSTPEKLEALRRSPTARFEHVLVTGRAGEAEAPAWHQELKRITAGRGVDVFFDPVAAGPYLQTEIRALAQHGTIWVYGLLGEPGVVDVSPLIRKHASIRGWLLGELIDAGGEALQRGYRHILDGFASGAYRQHVARTFRLEQVREAHAFMERGEHIGKLVLVP